MRHFQRIVLFSLVASFVFLASWPGNGTANVASAIGVGGGLPSVAAPQMVYMMPSNGGALPPSRDSIAEIVVMNLDAGTGRRQLYQ